MSGIGKITSVPAYPIEHQKIYSKTIGEFDAPPFDRLEIDAVFDGAPVFHLDMLMVAGGGDFAIVADAIYRVKMGERPTSPGWIRGRFKMGKS